MSALVLVLYLCSFFLQVTIVQDHNKGEFQNCLTILSLSLYYVISAPRACCHTESVTIINLITDTTESTTGITSFKVNFCLLQCHLSPLRPVA